MMMMMMMMVMTEMMCHWRARVSWSIPQGAGECNNVWPAIQYDILYKRWYLPHHHHRHITAQRSYPSSPSFNKKWGFSVIQWWSIGWGQSCTLQASIQQWIWLIALIVSDPMDIIDSLRSNFSQMKRIIVCNRSSLASCWRVSYFGGYCQVFGEVYRNSWVN